MRYREPSTANHDGQAAVHPNQTPKPDQLPADHIWRSASRWAIMQDLLEKLGITMQTIIYHNPRCGTSRNTLALIRHGGIEPAIIEYLKTPPDRATLQRLIADAGLAVREAVREKETLFGELGLDDPGCTDETLLDAMLAHPILINRPFVVTNLGTRLCRPSEVVLDILPPLTKPFTKEDGEVVIDEQGRRR